MGTSATKTANSSTAGSQGGVGVSITNNLTVAVDIYDVFNPGSAASVAPFTYTRLGSIAAGATASVTTIRNVSMLQAMYTGTIAELNGNYYYQFPIKFMSGTQLTYETPPPALAYTIEAADRLSAIQSFQFHKFAMANPSSALTGNLNTAIKTGSPTTINTFFAGTQNFKSCTYASWNAIMTWLQQFTSGWQGPYYLYQQAPSPMPQNYSPVLMATLNIVSTAAANSATLTMCSADSQGNPVFATSPQTTTVIMAGDGTMTDANPGSDVTLSLTPVWMNVIQSSMEKGTPVSSYVVGSAVTGTVAGTNVVSSQTARQVPGKPADPAKKSSFDASFGSICQTVGLLVGLLMLYEFITKKYNENKEAKEKAEADAKSKAEADKAKADADQATEQDISTEMSTPEATATFAEAPKVQDSYSQTTEDLQADVMTQTMDAQADAINEQINEQLSDGVTPTQDFEDAFSDMQTSFSDAKSAIESGDFETASTTLSDASTQMESAISTQGSAMESWETTALGESSAAVSEAAEANDALDAAQTEQENDMNDAANDSGYDADDESTPETDEIPPVE